MNGWDEAVRGLERISREYGAGGFSAAVFGDLRIMARSRDLRRVELFLRGRRLHGPWVASVNRAGQPTIAEPSRIGLIGDPLRPNLIIHRWGHEHEYSDRLKLAWAPSRLEIPQERGVVVDVRPDGNGSILTRLGTRVRLPRGENVGLRRGDAVEFVLVNSAFGQRATRIRQVRSA